MQTKSDSTWFVRPSQTKSPVPKDTHSLDPPNTGATPSTSRDDSRQHRSRRRTSAPIHRALEGLPAWWSRSSSTCGDMMDRSPHQILKAVARKPDGSVLVTCWRLGLGTSHQRPCWAMMTTSSCKACCKVHKLPIIRTQNTHSRPSPHLKQKSMQQEHARWPLTHLLPALPFPLAWLPPTCPSWEASGPPAGLFLMSGRAGRCTRSPRL